MSPLTAGAIRAHALLDLAEAVERRVGAAAGRVERVTPGVLGRAFAGELGVGEVERGGR